MAFVNPNKPAGLSPIGLFSGALWNSKVKMYAIAAADTNPYYPGDLVALTGAGDAATGLSNITLATAGNAALGVVVAVGLGNAGPAGAGGPYINANNLALTSRPSGAQTPVYYAAVIDDPMTVYEIQEGGTGTNLAAATGPGLNANILYAAPAAGVYVSGTTLNNVGVTTTATLNLRILELAQRIDNHFVTTPATGGGAQKWWVMVQNHQLLSRPVAP
jgi:hypothetical protein